MNREEYQPGDLSIRFSFGRVYGTGPDRGKIRPGIEITDQTSGLTLTLNLTPEDLAELFAAGAAQVPAASVHGFKGVSQWGKYLHIMTVNVKSESGDYAHKGKPRSLPHVAAGIAEIEAAGYVADTPHRNNQNQWVITGRKYEPKP
jgi:hypothetical protein